MKSTRVTFVILLLALALAAPATSLAQRQRGRQGSGRGQGFGGGGGMFQNFEAVAPDIGEAMPDVVVYDDEGMPHRLPDLLRGHYSVVILGCLT